MFLDVLKGWSGIFKSSFLCFLFTMIFSMVSLVIGSFNEKWHWLLCFILLLVVLVASVALVGLIARAQAVADFTVLNNNRVRMSRGEMLPKQKRLKEYRTIKGYVGGVLVCLPLIILLLIYVFCAGTAIGAWSAAIAKLAYNVYFLPFFILNAEMSVYILLIALPLNIVTFGLTYHLTGYIFDKRQMEFKRKSALYHKDGIIR